MRLQFIPSSILGVEITEITHLSTSSTGSEPSRVQNHSTESKSYCVHVGNRDWLTLNNIQVPKDIDLKMTKEEERGNITILCAVDGLAQNFLKPLIVFNCDLFYRRSCCCYINF
jgi:hypothetical protein